MRDCAEEIAIFFRQDDLGSITTLLCDADGNLFPSEEPAYAASVEVVNRLMEELGSAQRFDADQLRLSGTGRNFRSTAAELADACGASLTQEQLERWVAEEN